VIGPTLALRIDATGARSGASEFESATRRIDAAGAHVSRSLEGVHGSFDRLKASASSARTAMAAFAGGNVGAMALATLSQIPGRMVAIADAATKIRNSLTLVLGSSQDAADVFARLQNISIETGSSLEGLSDLFFRTSAAAKDLGLSREQLLGLVDTLAKLNSISGQTGQGAAAGMVQLGQALASANVQAEEWNGIADQLPALAKLFADHIEGAGGSVAKLKQMINQGEVAGKDLAAVLALRRGDQPRVRGAAAHRRQRLFVARRGAGGDGHRHGRRHRRVRQGGAGHPRP
jgi:tape measure domain-containing protein